MPKLEEDGLLLVDKPVGWTSFDVVGKIRGGLRYVFERKMKVGHAGTLDPLASGLLVIGYGRMTKQLEALSGQDKTYTGTLRLGEVTPSHDAETEVTERYPWEHISRERIQKAISAFTGEILQRPPIYSAKHHQGERAYFLAREGAANELKPVNVMIHYLSIIGVKGQEVDFEVCCGKGTYIRALAHDIGRALGCGAWLSALRRTKSGELSVDDARSPEAWSLWFDKVKEG